MLVPAAAQVLRISEDQTSLSAAKPFVRAIAVKFPILRSQLGDRDRSSRRAANAAANLGAKIVSVSITKMRISHHQRRYFLRNYAKYGARGVAITGLMRGDYLCILTNLLVEHRKHCFRSGRGHSHTFISVYLSCIDKAKTTKPAHFVLLKIHSTSSV